MCILIFSSTFVETFLILGRTERDMIKNIYWSSHSSDLSQKIHERTPSGSQIIQSGQIRCK